MKQPCSVLLALVLATLCGGCVSNKRYPAEWPPMSSIAGERCANVSGAYKNMDVDNRVSLSDVLVKRFYGSRYYGGATRVELRQTDASIDIASHFGDWLLDSKTLLFEKDYQCQEGRIVLTASGSVGGGGVAGYTWETFAFQRAEDGSLILHGKSSGMGVAAIIPIGGSESQYHRFEKFTP